MYRIQTDLPDEVNEMLLTMAKDNRRSRPAQVIVIIEEAWERHNSEPETT